MYYFDENGDVHIGVHNGIIGDVSGMRGDVDLCEIPIEDREKGIDINDLIG